MKQEKDTGEPDVCYSYEGILGEQLKIKWNGVCQQYIRSETEEEKVYYNLPVEYITSAYGEGIWSETMSRKFHWKTKKS